MVEHYNLDAILSVGYRVNSKRGTLFRIWATQTLKEHLTRGYTRFEQNTRELETALQLVRKAAAGWALAKLRLLEAGKRGRALMFYAPEELRARIESAARKPARQQRGAK